MSEFALARYDTGGSLDTASFGGGQGWVVTDFSGNSVDQAFSVALQSDGKIILAGFVNGVGADGTDDFGVARYLTTGFWIVSFGVGGKVSHLSVPTTIRPTQLPSSRRAKSSWLDLPSAGIRTRTMPWCATL